MLVVLAVGWVAAVFLSVGGAFSPSFPGAVLALLGAGVVLTGGAPLKSRLWLVPLAALSVLAGLGVRAPPSAVTGRGGTARVTCEVVAVRYESDRARIDCAVQQGVLVDRGEPLAKGIRLGLSTGLEDDPPVGSIVQVLARLRPNRVYRNLSPHPRWPWVVHHAFFGTIVAGSLEVLDAPRWVGMHGARRRVRRHAVSSLSPRAAGFVRALALGEGGAVPREDRRAVAGAGLSHVLAVSGLHVALVSGALVTMLRRLFATLPFALDPGRSAALVGIPISLLYAAFAGGTPSGWRAAITASVGWALVAMGRKPRSIPVAAFTVLVLSVPSPTLATRPAFLLSVLATAAIVTGGAHPGGALRSAAKTTTRAIVATIPVVWWCFGSVPAVGWVSNLLLLPLATIALIPLANLQALGAVVAPLAQWIHPVVEAVVQAFFAACRLLVQSAPSHSLPPLTVVQGALVALACVLALSVRGWRHRAAVAVSIAVLLLGSEWHARQWATPPGKLQVTFLDVGQGDASLIDLPSGEVILVDTGGGIPDPGARVILPLLRARRHPRIDLVVITHGHPDHYDGLGALIGHIEIGELWLPRQTLVEQPDGLLSTLVRKARLTGTTVKGPKELCNGARSFGDARIEVLWPCPRYDPGLDINDNSLVVKLEHEGHAYLFTGDIEREAEEALVRTAAGLRADVLKVAHHGSRTSSLPGFVRATDPKLSVVSSGRGNRYGHPHPNVLARLAGTGSEVLRTDDEGSIVVVSDEESLRVRTWKSREWRTIP